MATTSGLTRRRGAGQAAAAENGGNAFANGTSPATSTNPSPIQSPSGTVNGGTGYIGGALHAGTAMEGGSKVAYDPRDLGGNDEERKVPRLTIMEEILLLGLKDQQGYLSFWNDNISYALRGCILIELALRKRIAVVRDPGRRRFPLPDRLIEVTDERQTGETILDEALKMIKANEKMGVGSWIDLLSGETWNVLKIHFQLRQVRERLAKGLVDKGILRTEKRNFLLFDMATHPISDIVAKELLVGRVTALLTSRTAALPERAIAIPSADGSGGSGSAGGSTDTVEFRIMRSVALVCASYAASVLDNALARLSYDEREAAFGRCDEILAEFATWPFGSSTGGGGGGPVTAGSSADPPSRRRTTGSGGVGRECVLELVRECKKEMMAGGSGGEESASELHFEVIATVLEVFSRMDSLWS